MPGSNGGVYFHTVFQDGDYPRKGFEVQVNNTYQGDPVKTSSLYHVQDLHEDQIKGIAPENQWFTEDIIVQGKTVVIKLNGKEVVNRTHHRLERRPRRPGPRHGPQHNRAARA